MGASRHQRLPLSLSLLLFAGCGGKIAPTDKGPLNDSAWVKPKPGKDEAAAGGLSESAEDGSGGSTLPSLPGPWGSGGTFLEAAGGTSALPTESGGAPPGDGPELQAPLIPEQLMELAGQAFQLVPEGELSRSCVDGCQPLTIFFENVSEERLHVVWAAKGRVERIPFERSGDVWVTQAHPMLGKEWSPSRAQGMTTLWNAVLELSEREDGRPELVLTGTGSSSYARGGTSFPIVLRGWPDSLAPEVALAENPASVLAAFWFPVTKPLASDAIARLIPSAGEPLPLVPTLEEGWIVGFGTSLVLPYDAHYVVEVGGEDFLGLGSPSPADLWMEPSFGVIDDGTFSSGSPDGIRGGELLELQFPSEDAPNRVLAGTIGELVTLHLPIQPNASELRLDVWVYTTCEEPSAQAVTFFPFLIGEDRELIAPRRVAIGAETGALPIRGGVAHVDAAAQQLVIPLGMVQSTDLVLAVSSAGSHPGPCFKSGVILDNVRLE